MGMSGDRSSDRLLAQLDEMVYSHPQNDESRHNAGDQSEKKNTPKHEGRKSQTLVVHRASPAVA